MSDAYLGEIRMFGGDYAPRGWLTCSGQVLQKAAAPELCGLLGKTFGGDGDKAFGVPDLRGRLAIGAGASPRGGKYEVASSGGTETITLTTAQLGGHSHTPRAQASALPTVNNAMGNVWAQPSGTRTAYAPLPASIAMNAAAISSVGGGQAHENVMPFLALTFLINATGPDPRSPESAIRQLQPMLAQICLLPVDAIPPGWVACDGRLLQIADYQALYSIVGNTFGGDGRRTFGVPDLRGRVPMNPAAGAPVGASGGTEQHALTSEQLPQHTHQVFAMPTAANPSTSPRGRTWGPIGGAGLNPVFGAMLNGKMSKQAMSLAGSGEPHDNMQPYMALTFCMNVQGVFPRRP